MNPPGPAPAADADAAAQVTTIVYDGGCPFCSRFVRLTRLRQAVGPVLLLDARGGAALPPAIAAARLDLNQGMVLLYRGQLYHGAQCLLMLALLSSEARLCNRLYARLFRSPGFCRYSYPPLRAGRNLALKLIGRGQLE